MSESPEGFKFKQESQDLWDPQSTSALVLLGRKCLDVLTRTKSTFTTNLNFSSVHENKTHELPPESPSSAS